MPPSSAGFAPYFCRLINQPTNAAIIYVQGVDGETLAIDLVAMGLVVLVTILLLVGVREATAVNNFTTWTSVICIIVTIVAGGYYLSCFGTLKSHAQGWQTIS